MREYATAQEALADLWQKWGHRPTFSQSVIIAGRLCVICGDGFICDVGQEVERIRAETQAQENQNGA